MKTNFSIYNNNIQINLFSNVKRYNACRHLCDLVKDTFTSIIDLVFL